MRHIAWIITAGSDSGARFAAPFLLPAVRFAAAACCAEVREGTEKELDSVRDAIDEDTALLVLDAAMPLITADDCRALFEAVEDGAARAVALDAEGDYPRCECQRGRKEREVELSEDALFAVETPYDLVSALKTLRQRRNEALMDAGVILIDPKRTYIDPDVKIGPGTVVYPNNTLTGGTVVGVRCTLLPGNRIHASTVGNDATVENSVLTECAVGDKTTVGPFAYLRPGAKVGANCRIGDFVEIKNSNVSDGAKISHLTYVGDGDVGRDVNLGCGVVFTNYDGKHKQRSAVADGAFVGCNVNLVAPVRVGKNAYVAAGTTVTSDVPDGALAIGRARQENKPGWVAKRRTEGKL